MTDRISTRKSPTTRICVTLPAADWDTIADVAERDARTVANQATVVLHRWCEDTRRREKPARAVSSK